jgi:hypothetical protein
VGRRNRGGANQRKVKWHKTGLLSKKGGLETKQKGEGGPIGKEEQ